ncbi:MAG: hypothetical protein IIW48_01375 [Clostridia bacterium]|nr:hypothetical protein [Clostridia bacterium]
MKHSKLVALICVIAVVLTAAFCAGAAEVPSAEYRIPVNGDKPISEEQAYNVKVIALDASYNGKTENLTIWVTKEDQKDPRLVIMDSSGKLLSMSETDYVASRKSNALTNGDFFTVSIKNGKLITACDGDDKTRDMLMLKGMTFANVELFGGAYDVAVGPVTTQPAEQTTSEVQAEPEEETEQKAPKNTRGIGWLILAIAAIVVGIGFLVAYIVLNAKSSEKSSKPQIQTARPPVASYTPPRRTEPVQRPQPDAPKQENPEGQGDIYFSAYTRTAEPPVKPALDMYGIAVKQPESYTSEQDIDVILP